jgi:MbtH protein
MALGDSDDSTIYVVVVNDEEQYSIWAEGQDIPAGWRSVGVRGPKAECLDHIERVWTDMRPLSVRRAMEQSTA